MTSINLNANWGLVGVGTSHGFGLFDYMQVSLLKQKHSLLKLFINKTNLVCKGCADNQNLGVKKVEVLKIIMLLDFIFEYT